MSPRPFRRLAPLVTAVAALSALAACGGEDPFAPRATLDTIEDTVSVYALSSAPSLYPSALAFYGIQRVRPIIRSTGLLNFDLALDVDASGKVRLIPPRALVAPQGSSLVTGVQVLSGTSYSALTRAPNNGYQYDSVTVVSPGQVVAVQTQGAGSVSLICLTTAPLYAKLVVDSVRPVGTTQQIYMRTRVDPNCGFRSLEPGLPSS